MRFSLRFSGTKPFFYHIINIMWYFLHRLQNMQKAPELSAASPKPFCTASDRAQTPARRKTVSGPAPGIFHKNYEHFVNKADFCRMILYNVSIRQRLLPLFFRASVSASFSRCTTLYRLWLCFAGIRAVSGCDRLIIFI